MTVNELKARLESEMAWADSMLTGIDGIIHSAEVENNEGTSYVFGVVMIATPEMADEDRIYISLEADISIDDEVDGEGFDRSVSAFRKRIDGISKRLKAVNDPPSLLREIAKEIDSELDEEYKAELARIDRETKDRIKIAVSATVLLLVVAAAAIIVRILLR